MPTSFPNLLDNFSNPSATTKLNDPAFLHHQQHTNVNDAVESLEQKVGINLSNINSTLDFARYLYFLTENQHTSGIYRVITGQPFPTKITWYSTMTADPNFKLVEKEYEYGPATKKFITKVTYRLYSGGSVIRTITDEITLNNGGVGPFEETRIRSIA